MGDSNQQSRLDLIVFGATGYTGQYVIEEVIRTIDKENDGLTWAVAGRSETKLKQSLAEAARFMQKDLSAIEIIVADTSDEASILAMCKRAKCIVNCVGPYRFCKLRARAADRARADLRSACFIYSL